jgi:hypothetical protein
MKWEGGQVSLFPNPPPQLCSIHLGVVQLQDTDEMESAQDCRATSLDRAMSALGH